MCFGTLPTTPLNHHLSGTERALVELQRALVDDSDGTVALPPLPRASSAPLVQADLVRSPLRGLCVVASTTAMGGDYLLCYDTGAALATLDLMGSPHDASGDVAAASARPGAPAPSPWRAETDEWEKRRPKAIPRVDLGGKTRLDQLAAVRELAFAYRSHAAHLAEGRDILHDARDEAERRRTAVLNTEGELESRLERCEERSATFAARLQMTQRNHKNLMDRCAVIESIVMELQPGLTDAERAFHAELKTRERDAKRLLQVLEGLESFVESHAELFAPPRRRTADTLAPLDDTRMALVQAQLDDQNQQLSLLVAGLKELQLATGAAAPPPLSK